MSEIITQCDVWVKTEQAAQILGVSVKTVGNYKKHLKSCGMRDEIPKHGIYQNQLYIMMKLKEEIQINGLTKAKMNIKQFINSQKQEKTGVSNE